MMDDLTTRIRIKMCGVTRFADAMAGVEAGVDALGFIFYKKSPRNIDPEEARILIEQLPPFVDVVGVFVDKKRSEVEEIVQYCRLGYAQLHGNESPKYCERLGRYAAPCRVIKALRVGGELTAQDVVPYQEHVNGFLLDTYRKGQPGGTGESFDWSLVKKLNFQKPIILAGGLECDNVVHAIKMTRPYGVDVNSGVEQSPGIKDHTKIRKFVTLVRSMGS